MHLTAKVVFHVTMLLASGAVDARTTNLGAAKFGPNWHEHNPMVRPFVGTNLIYPAIMGADLAMYTGLRRLHKPHAADWWARAEAGENFACAVSNHHQSDKPKK